MDTEPPPSSSLTASTGSAGNACIPPVVTTNTWPPVPACSVPTHHRLIAGLVDLIGLTPAVTDIETLTSHILATVRDLLDTVTDTSDPTQDLSEIRRIAEILSTTTDLDPVTLCIAVIHIGLNITPTGTTNT